jgi:hypothetical protein
VRTTKDQTVAAGHSVELVPTRWRELFEKLMGRAAGGAPAGSGVENAQVAVYLIYATAAGPETHRWCNRLARVAELDE